MDAERTTDGVIVRFPYHEVFVLSEMLDRWNRDGTDLRPELYEDQAEQRVLRDLCAVLEPMIDEAFSPTYGEVLDRARAAIRDPE